jgi:hypothetical protein
MICDLSQNNLKENLENYVNALIEENFKNPKFSYVDIVNTIKQDVMDEKGDLTQALGIAYHVPQMIYDLIKNNPEFDELEFLKKGYDLTKLLTEISKLKEAEDKITAIAKMLGVTTTSVAEMEKIISGQPTDASTIIIKAEGSDTLSVDKALSNGTYLSSTSQSSKTEKIEGEKVSVINVTDPDHLFYQQTRSKILLARKDADQDFNEIEYDGHKGFRAVIMLENQIPGKLRPNRENMLQKNVPVLVITDNEGNIMYFDEKTGKIANKDTGKPIYDTLKKISDNNAQKIIESLKSQLKNLSPEEEAIAIANIKKQIKEEEKILEDLKRESKAGPILVNITGGSIGVAQKTEILDRDKKHASEAFLSDFDKESYEDDVFFVPEVINGVTVSVPAVKFKLIDGYTTLKNPEKLGVQAPDLLADLVNILTEDVGLTDIEKVEYVGQFISLRRDENKNNPKAIPYSIGINSSKGNNLYMNIDGKNVPFENKDLAKEMINDLLFDLNIHFKNELYTNRQFDKYTLQESPTGYSIVKKESLPYIPFIFSKIVPRVAFDKTSKGPVINNGYLTFQPILTQAAVNESVAETTKEIKEKDIPTTNTQQEEEDDDLLSSKLIEDSSSFFQNSKAENWWTNESALSKAVDENGKPLFTLNLLRNIVNSDAWATFSGSVITLYKGAGFSQVYHEAWHAFSQVYLTKDQKTDLYKSVANLKGSFDVVKRVIGPGGLTFEKVKVNFANIDVSKRSDRLLLEEFLADEFKKFAMNNGKFITKSEKNTLLGRIFDRIWRALKALVGNSDMYTMPGSDAVLNDIFSKLYQAKTAEDLMPYSPNLQNAEFGLLNSGGIVSEDVENNISISEGLLLTRTIDGMLSQFVTKKIQQENKFSAATKIFSSRKGLTDLYNNTKKEFDDKRKELVARRDSLPTTDTQEISILNNKISLFTKALNLFGDINKALAGQSAEASVIAFHRNNSIFKELFLPFKLVKEEASEHDSDTGDYEETSEDAQSELAVSFDAPINGVASEKLADQMVIYLVKSLIKQNKNGEFELNEIGFVEPIEFLPFWRVLMDKASGETSVLGLYNKLVEAGKNVSPLFNQLLSKIYVQQLDEKGKKLSPSDSIATMFQKGSEIGDLWMKFVQSTNLHRIDIIANYIEQNSRKGTEIRVGKTSDDYKHVINTDWPVAFQQKEKDGFINKIESVNYINLDAVTNRYLIKGVNTENKNTYTVAKENYIPFLNSIGLYIDNISEIKDILKPEDINFIADAIGKTNEHAVKKERNIDNIVAYLSASRVLSDGTRIENNAYAVNYLAQLQVAFSTEYTSSMKYTADSKLKSAFAYNNSDTQKINAMKKSTKKGDLFSNHPEFVHMNSFNPLNNPGTKGSIIFNSLYSSADDGKKVKGNDINYRDLSGTTFVDEEFVSNGVSISKMGFLDKVLSTFISTLGGGYIEGVQPSDKSSNFAVKLNFINTYKGKLDDNLYVDTVAFIKNNEGKSILGIDPMQKVLEMLYVKLEGEIRRINMIKADPEYYNKMHGFERATEFDIFDEMLDEETDTLKNILKSKETFEELNKVGDLYILLNNNPKLKEKIDKEILTFFDNHEKEYERVLFDPIFGKGTQMPAALNALVISKIAGKNEEKNIGGKNDIEKNLNIKQAAIRSYMINNFIHKTETTFLLQGENFQFDHAKDEMTKRTSGSQSGGTVFPVDELTKIFIDSKVGRPYEQKLIKDKVIGEKIVRTYGPTLNTAIIEESIVTSTKFNMYRDLFKNDFINKGITDPIKLDSLLYGINPDTGLPGSDATDDDGEYIDVHKGGKMDPFVNIKDGDGQGWISFDTYRILKRAEGTWTDSQEALYFKVVNGENISASDLTDMFPVYKLQYNGALATELNRIPIYSFHKFSLFPLIPSVIKNFPADTLHKAMIAQDIDYALFPSGSKRCHIKSSPTSKGDVVFDKNSANIKPISDINFTKNTIYISYLKNQTAINNYFKDTATFSSQLRKLIITLLYKNGVPVDYINANNFTNAEEAIDAWEKEPYKRTLSQFHDYAEEFRGSVEDFVEFKKKELLDELEWTEDDLYAEQVDEVKMQSLLKFIDSELEKQGFSEHERSDLSSNSNIFNIDLSTSPLAARFEKMIMAIVNNRIVKPKLKGEPLVEVSSALMQSGRFRKPTKEETATYDNFNGTNGLESYVVDPEGKFNTLGFMFKRALTIMDEGLFELDYFTQDENGDYVRSGETIAVYKPKEKDESREIDSDRSLARLNEMLKVKAWRASDNNYKKLRLTGVRIPTQGHNSMEFGEVAEFLNPAAGPIIIIPAEIVAKSGTDFDVDKMTAYLPYITRNGNLMEKMTEEDIDEREQELKEKFDKLALNKRVIDIIKDEKKTKWLDIRFKLNNFRKAIATKAKVGQLDAKLVENLTSNKSKVVIKTMSEPGMEEYVKNFIPKAYKIYEKTIKGVTIEDVEVIENALATLYEEKSELSKVYKERADLNDNKNNMIGGIQNKLIEDMVNILQLPYLAASLMSPNDTNLVKPYADELKEYIQKADNQADFTKSIKTGRKMYKKGISSTKVYTETYNNKRHQENYASKDSLGIAAVDNYVNILLNTVGGVMKKNMTVKAQVIEKGKPKTKNVTVDISLNLPSNKLNGAISLSDILDKEGINSIADVINQMMNGFVDAGKDAWIAYLQGNIEVIPKFLFLLEAGVPVSHIAYLVSNPMIRQYVKEKANGKAVLANLLPSIARPSDVAKNMLNEISFSPNTAINLDPKKESYIYGLQSALKEKTVTNDFDKDTLKSVAQRSLDYTDREQVAGFLEYLYVESLIEDYDALKKAMNPDTKHSSDLYSAQAKIEEVSGLMNNPTMETGPINKLATNSIISPFFIQDFARRLFSRLFKLRDDAQVNNFLINTFKDRKEAAIAKKATGFDTETYIVRFKNFLSQYIFANELRVYKSGDTTYKGMPITSEDLEQFNKDFEQGLYLETSDSLTPYLYKNNELATINAQAFPSIVKEIPNSDGTITSKIIPNEKLRTDFIEFSLEREYLREKMPLMDANDKTKFNSDVVDTKEFNLRRQRLVNSGYSKYTQKTDESATDYMVRLNKYTYEDMLANKALTNTYNIWQLFRSGDNTVAKELMDIITNYPEISDSTNYSILKQFMPQGIPNKPMYKNVLNFQLANYANLDEGLVSEYNKQWNNLAKSSKPKLTGKDVKANTYISEFFQKLPIYAFLQSGMDSGKFSLSSVMPYDEYKPIMDSASEKFIKKLETTDSDKILQGIKKLFEKENSNANKKLKSRGPLLKVDLADLPYVENSIYEQPFIEQVINNNNIPIGLFNMTNTYVENGRVYPVTQEKVNMLRKNNPSTIFLLSPADLVQFKTQLTPQEFEVAKNDINTFINKIISSGNDVVIFSEGFSDSPKTFDKTFSTPVNQPAAPTYSIEPGRFVANQGVTYIVIKKNDNGTWQVYNPNATGANSKKSFSEANLTPGANKAIKVRYRDADYLVTPKDTIISLTTGTKMEWKENDGNRIAILKLKDGKPVSNQPVSVPVTQPSTSFNKVLEGDIFALPGIPVITTNLGGVHGAGLAQAAKAKGLVKQGEGNFKATDDVVQLPVKKKWSDDMSMNNNMELLKESLRSLIKVSKENPTKTYLLPLAGLGHGEGSIEDILPLLIKTVQASPNIKLVIPAENVNLGRQGTVRKDYTRENLPKIKTMLSEAGLSTTQPQAPVSMTNPFNTSKVQQKVYHVDKRKDLNEKTLVDDMTMVFPSGVFFTTEKAYAENYAKAIGGVIYEAYVDVQNPLTTTNKQEIERLGRKSDEVPAGVDSVIHKSDDVKADKYGKIGTEIVVYKSEQIKLIVPTQAPVSIDKKLTKEEADWLMDNLKLITKTYNSSTLYGTIDIELKDPIIIGETKVTHIAPDVSGNPSIIFERPSGRWMVKIEEKKGNLFTRLYKWADYNKKGEFSFYGSEDSQANDKVNIEKAGLNPLIQQLYTDTNIPDPGTRLGQFEAANFLQQKYGLKRTYKDIVNQLMSKAQIQTLDFKTIPNLTLERKREILTNFAAKHKMTPDEAYKYINEAIAEKGLPRVLEVLNKIDEQGNNCY